MMTRDLSRKRHAFTLIEMIGVLAVIAILASLLVPKIFESINNAHMSQTVLSCQTIKTAVLEHYAKYLSLASSNGNNLTFAGGGGNNPQVLLAEGLIDKPFSPMIGTTSTVQVVDISQVNQNKPLGGAYDLDGDGNVDVLGANYLVEAVIYGATQADARAINDVIDGAALGELVHPRGQAVDEVGRVVYNNGSGPNSAVFEVHIYITHH